MIFNENNIFANFLSSYDAELSSKISRLDELIGHDHWLSVGNYKESLLRSLISNILPRKYEISTGFILASNREGEIIKSKQIDIIIWDSSNYSPIFRDGDFVVIPPESCSAVIEVKGKLNHDSFEESLLNIDSLIPFCLTAYTTYNYIKKYIFAFDIAENFKFPNSLWQKIYREYTFSDVISLKERMELSNKSLNSYRCWNPLFSVDSIFVLPIGLIKRSSYFLDNIVHFNFEAYTAVSNTRNYTYAYFETDLQTHLITNGKQESSYINLPGLSSVKENINIAPTLPKSRMIFPALEKDNTLYEHIGGIKKVFFPRKVNLKDNTKE